MDIQNCTSATTGERTEFATRWLANACCIGLFEIAVLGVASATPPTPPSDEAVTAAVYVDQPGLTESSGLAASPRRPGHFWTHNDSGAAPLLYAVNSDGRVTGRAEFPTLASAVDWEDMASFVDQEMPRLIVADCGDNDRQRSAVTLVLLDEPDPTTTTRVARTTQLKVRYPDGPADCEAVAVDVQRRQIVLITKSALPACGIHVVPLPSRDHDGQTMEVLAQRIGTLPLPMVTGMDLDVSSGDVWLVNYFQAFRFVREDHDESLAVQLARVPQPLTLPRWRQIEAIAVDSAHGVWITSEGQPAPLGRLKQP